MNITLPKVSQVLVVVAVLDAHPLGSLFLFLFGCLGLAAYWLWKQPKSTRSGPSARASTSSSKSSTTTKRGRQIGSE
jgi:hypothetical protein